MAGLRGKGICQIKQKVSGSTSAQKLRGIIPNTTVLRLLTNVVLAVVRPFSARYSEDNGLNVEVLGASKGGQTMDMAHTAQYALMWGRDDGDKAACGQMDIKNYHDSMSRSEMWRCQMRRDIPTV